MSVSVCDSPENCENALSKSDCESSSTKAPFIFRFSIAPSSIGSSSDGNSPPMIDKDMKSVRQKRKSSEARSSLMVFPNDI